MSRQSQQHGPSTPDSPSPDSASRPSSSGINTNPDRITAHGPTPVSEGQSSSPQSPRGLSSSSEGYPSWLPKRPPGPVPHSTIQSSVAGMYSEAGPSHEPVMVGRKPTPRSVRIVSLQSQMEKDTRREPTEQSRAFSGAGHARAWSRATSAALTPTLFSSSAGGEGQLPRPRFKSPTLNLELVRNPSWQMRLWYYLFPIFVFAHVPLQTFFDFNAVFILLSVAKNPNPEGPGIPGSGRNWALGAAAYIACWVAWVFVVGVVYELVYSFVRRWRVKRPLILPIYFSSPAFNFAAMTSYLNFCFMYHIRASAFFGEHGSVLDGLAETFYFYSQNLPTVALLLPRAGLSLALLLAFSSPDPVVVALADAGVSRRDGAYFRADGTLTDFARGVLIANAAWTAWRVLVLLTSWIGLWLLSGQACAGFCGPRYRWEEEDAEKAVSALTDDVSDLDTLPWSWKECTILRIKDAYDFCLTNKPVRLASDGAKEGKPVRESQEPAVGYDGLERIFAAVGLPSSPAPARRGILSDELFASPRQTPELDEAAAVKGKGVAVPEPLSTSLVPPTPALLQQREKQGADPSGPLMKLPYPFTGYGAQISNEDVVPFPPSPAIDDKDLEAEHAVASRATSGTRSGTTSGTGEEYAEGEEDLEEMEEEEESENPSSERRTSGSMSSLGRPVTSRYPFQFRRPRGSMSSASHMSPQSRSTPRSTNTRSTQSRSTRHSRSTQSTGNQESTDYSPRSNASSNVNSSFSGSVIPMPPRHPQAQQTGRRARAGTVPASPSSPSPVAFPAGRARARTRTESAATEPNTTFGPIPIGSFESGDDDDDDDIDTHHDIQDESLVEVPEGDGSSEEAERQDSVGLLSNAPSPRTSLANLRQRASALALHRRANGSRSQSSGSQPRSRSNSAHTRSRTNSGTSLSSATRSRAQSLIHSLGAASRSSVDLVERVRLRTNSLGQRLSDSPYASTSSEAILSSPENHTFGHPLREEWRAEEGVDNMSDIAEGESATRVAGPDPHANPDVEPEESTAQPPQTLHPARSTLSEHPSEISAVTEREGVPITGAPSANVPQTQTQDAGLLGVPHQPSMADISTAPQSFITTPSTREDTTSSSGRTQRTFATMEHYTHGADWHPV
ncbi:uncharacterized protein BXZ73DRAFT_54228 [Epithele typhae]|uniref:uncharacterized protein n=1 Tax=Epithele typhae TaxID=378194 RepID=UPI0020085555|nr:uncharacterized protein BXZ73DRAFT_54228 [Epithele typhae]KAH9915584.1 hypothetical protein BXZ73DRAFT_54228 [Epithele typhae]